MRDMRDTADSNQARKPAHPHGPADDACVCPAGTELDTGAHGEAKKKRIWMKRRNYLVRAGPTRIDSGLYRLYMQLLCLLLEYISGRCFMQKIEQQTVRRGLYP